MGFNCLKASATSKRQFTFHHKVLRNPWFSLYRSRKDEKLSRPWRHPAILNTWPVDWESSTLTTRPLLHKGGFHKGAFIIAHIRRLYLMWYLINSWRLLSGNPQPHPPPPPPPPPSSCRKGGRTLRTGFSFSCGIVFHYRFRYDVLSEKDISTLWSFGGMYILPSPVFFKGENSPSKRVGNLWWWEYDKEWFWPFESSWKLKAIFCK